MELIDLLARLQTECLLDTSPGSVDMSRRFLKSSAR
jgi:hypothetical protein